MEDPKRQAWMYLVAGVVAIVAAIYFLSTESQAGTYVLLDWGILAMGVVAIYRGGKGFYDLRRDQAKPTSTTVIRPGSSESKPKKPDDPA
ncbi:MAG: hypothetical protein QM779_16055 [Propionicimonas sp.]|uniref:hypothetical protein n=1 Tax=Propionicimonas sp. TaxID=1955623 RepID=UPI003D11C2C9